MRVSYDEGDRHRLTECAPKAEHYASDHADTRVGQHNITHDLPAFAREAEIAFSIESEWQSHGIGSALLERTLLVARNRSINRLHMACLANNRRMQDLARKFSAELSFDFGSVVGEVAAPRPTPLSMIREMVADGHGFATAMLDVQSRMMRTA